jgi:hypothetical protein
MNKIFFIVLLITYSCIVYSQSLVKNQYKSVLLLNDSSIYSINDIPTIQAIQYAGKEIGYHAFYKESHLLHATFIKKDEFFVFEEYDQNGHIISKGKLLQNVIYCKKDSQSILSPITLKEIEKHITCYYNLIKIGQWEYNYNDIKTKGNYFNGKKDGIWKTFINDNRLSNLRTYKMDSILADSNINSVNNYSKDSLSNLLNSIWYVTPINKNTSTFIFEKNTNDYTFDYTLKINNNNLFEKSYKFKIDNTPNNFTGNWRLNDDKSLTLTYNNKETILYILYIDNKEIIIKETNNKI